MQRRRVGDRVHPVERVREVDEPALLADRGDRVRIGHPAWDLLLEEEPDHLALGVGLHLLARDHGECASAREFDRLQGAAEDVVVGDRDRPQPLRVGVVEQLLDADRAIVRPRGVHVQVGDDPRPVGKRVGIGTSHAVTATAGESAVDPVQLARDVAKAQARGAAGRSLPLAHLVVAGQPRDRCCGQLWLLERARRRGDRGAGRGSLEQEPRRARRRRSDDRRLGEDRCPRLRRAPRADANAVTERARNRRPSGERLRAQEDDLPAGEIAQGAKAARATGNDPECSSITISFRLLPGAKSSRSTPGESTR